MAEFNAEWLTNKQLERAYAMLQLAETIDSDKAIVEALLDAAVIFLDDAVASYTHESIEAKEIDVSARSTASILKQLQSGDSAESEQLRQYMLDTQSCLHQLQNLRVQQLAAQPAPVSTVASTELRLQSIDEPKSVQQMQQLWQQISELIERRRSALLES